MKQQEGDKLIAEYMGEKVNFPNFIDGFKTQYLLPTPEGKKVHFREFELDFYRKDWNYLIPVVEKIEKETDNYYFEIVENSCWVKDISLLNDEDEVPDDTLFHLDGETKLEATWKAVVKLLEHINESK